MNNDQAEIYRWVMSLPKYFQPIANNLTKAEQAVYGHFSNSKIKLNNTDMTQKQMAAKGGKSRAKSLTPDRRQEIAKRAAEERWRTKGIILREDKPPIREGEVQS